MSKIATIILLSLTMTLSACTTGQGTQTTAGTGAATTISTASTTAAGTTTAQTGADESEDSRAENAAGHLLAIAKDHLEKEDLDLAVQSLDRVLDRYPESAAAEEAKTLRDEAHAKIEAAERALLLHSIEVKMEGKDYESVIAMADYFMAQYPEAEETAQVQELKAQAEKAQ